jgi:hypothetical protein
MSVVYVIGVVAGSSCYETSAYFNVLTVLLALKLNISLIKYIRKTKPSNTNNLVNLLPFLFLFYSLLLLF